MPLIGRACNCCSRRVRVAGVEEEALRHHRNVILFLLHYETVSTGFESIIAGIALVGGEEGMTF